MNPSILTSRAEQIAARMDAVYVPDVPNKPFRTQLVNIENSTAVWFEFDTEEEAKLLADRLNFAVGNMPIDAIVGAYPAGAKCPRKTQ